MVTNPTVSDGSSWSGPGRAAVVVRSPKARAHPAIQPRIEVLVIVFLSLFFHPRGRLQISKWVARVVVVVSIGIPMVQEEFHTLHRNGKPKPFAKSKLHIGHANYLAAHVKKRATT